MFENIDMLLAIDPTYLALFGGVSLAVTEGVKIILNRLNYSLGDMAVVVVAVVAGFLSLLLVPFGDGWRQELLSAIVMTYLIASSASGTYSWVKKDPANVVIPDYSDEA